MSAVLIAMHLGSRSVANSDLTLWKNPWAARPMTDELPWRTVVGDLDQNHLVTIEPAKAPREVLGLDAGWPVSSAA